jgi:ABC-type multidrug transport system permease subunit
MSYLHDHNNKKWRTFKQDIESDTIIVNIIINLFLLFITYLNKNKLQVYLRFEGEEYRRDAKVNAQSA